jgi:hypothetical protein
VLVCSILLTAGACAEFSAKSAPGPGDFDFDPDTGSVCWIYPDLSGISTVYVDSEGVVHSERPTVPGTYTVKVSTTENEIFSAATDVTGPWIYYVDKGTVNVSRRSGGLVYGEKGSVVYNVAWSGVSFRNVPASDMPVVSWPAGQPDGLQAVFSYNSTVLTFSTAKGAGVPAGTYKCFVVFGSLISEEIDVKIEPKEIVIPEITTALAYNGKVQAPVKEGAGYVIRGTGSSDSVGIYAAALELADSNNYIWDDGSTKPLMINWEITKRPVIVSNIKVFDKICDGTTTCVLNCTEAVFKGILKDDELSCTATGHFDSPGVGSGKPVELMITLTGPDKDNYYIEEGSQTHAAGTIIRSEETGTVQYVSEREMNYRSADLINGTEAIETILTAEDRKLIKNGADLKIWLSISDITASVPAKDMEKVDTVRGDAMVAAYLDINIFRQYGNSENTSKVSETKSEVEIEFKVPQNLINHNSTVNRNYQLVRVHDGEAEVLEAEFDKNTNTIRFRTDKFSTYALVYNDVKIRPAQLDFFRVDLSSTAIRVLFVLILFILVGAQISYYVYVKPHSKKQVYTGKH